jgi:uncharacterized protein
MATIAVTRNDEEHRFELRVDGVYAGRIEFSMRSGAIALNHTVVEDEFGGRGLAGELVAAALRMIRDEGLPLLPYCPYVLGYLRRHPEEVDLVPADRRARFGLE